jgi:hypothetical protein
MKKELERKWKVEIWAEDEDHRLRRDDRARERVKVAYVSAASADEAKNLVLGDNEVARRWPRANAAAFRVAR